MQVEALEPYVVEASVSEAFDQLPASGLRGRGGRAWAARLGCDCDHAPGSEESAKFLQPSVLVGPEAERINGHDPVERLIEVRKLLAGAEPDLEHASSHRGAVASSGASDHER
jgi:hypothetical protein